jgi:predicted MFS family arabinose efflux permease
VARFLTGIGIGLMASTATAYLHDLYAPARPDRARSHLPALVASAANLGGLALGPLVAGILAQWAPAPLLTPYVLFAITLAILLVLILVCPETVDNALTDGRPARFALLEGNGPLFASSATLGFVAFAVIGLFSALGAIIFRVQLGVTSLFVVAMAPFSAFAASAVAQLALARVRHRTALLTGIALFAVGLTLTVLGLHAPTPALLITAISLAGAGAGLLFKTAVGLTAVAARPSSRAGVLAVFFAIAYIGMGAPSIAFSIVEHAAGRTATMAGFGILMTVAAVLASIVPARRS